MPELDINQLGFYNDDPMSTTIEQYYEHWWKIEQAFAFWASQHNTNPKALFTIAQLYHYPQGCNQGELCEKLAFPKQTLSSILQKFEQNGIISREIHPADRRNKLVKLTPKGIEETADMIKKLASYEIAVYQSFTPEEREALLLILNKLVASLEKQ